MIDATLHGDLGTILDWAAEKREKLAETRALKDKTDTFLLGVLVSLVAGARNRHQQQGLFQAAAR